MNICFSFIKIIFILPDIGIYYYRMMEKHLIISYGATRMLMGVNVMQVSDRRNAGDLVMQFYLHMLSIHNEFAEQKKYNKILYILKHKSLDKSKFDI